MEHENFDEFELLIIEAIKKLPLPQINHEELIEAIWKSREGVVYCSRNNKETPMTKQSQYAEKLISAGLKEEKNPRTSKYRVFHWKNDTFIFLGRNGAIRYGKNASSSFSSTEKLLDRVVQTSCSII